MGTRWALWRLAPWQPGIEADVAPRLEASLADADPAVRGHAALALSAVRGQALPSLAGDLEAFDVFEHRTGALRRITVAQAARGVS